MSSSISLTDVQTACAEPLSGSNTISSTRDLSVLQIGKYYPPHRGGMETHLQSLCERLNRLMHVEVIVANHTQHTITEHVNGIKVTRLASVAKLASAPICPSMLATIRRSSADLIHIHLPNPTAILAYLMSGHPGKLIFTYHSDIVRQRYLSRLYDPLQRIVLNRADAIIASSSKYLDTSNVLPAFRNRCRVIPFGIETETLEKTDARQVTDIRSKYGDRIVLGVGRLVYYKGFEFLVRAMAKVDGHLLIVGQGPLREHLQAVITKLGINHRATILSEVKDVIPYYHAAAVFALPSIARSEAFGLVQLEAMACGKPVVNTNLASGVPFVSLDKVTGLTVPPADADALSVALNSLLNNVTLCREYGAAGRKRVAQEFEIDEMVRRTVEIYSEAMDG